MCSSPVPHSQMSRSSSVELVPRRFEQRALGQLELALHRLGHAVIDVPLPAAQVFPRADQLDAALLERLARVGHQPLGIEAVELAQPVARRGTCPAGC